jgi:HEPN domain-containing protein
MREITINQSLTAPVSFIVHTLTDVNAQLERGRPFFVDIVDQGIALYEAEGFAFAQPRDLPADEARIEAQKHFQKWFKSATAFRSMARTALEEENFNEAAFVLHQATEHLYHCTLLVISLYSPKSHRLNFLRSQCEQIAPALVDAWPRGDKFSRRCFELLRQAYVNSRYSPHYEISAEELEWIGSRVTVLENIVETICRDHLANLENADRAAE